MSAFRDAVYEAVRQIPRGQVATYGQVARVVGRPRSARFVGYALHANPEPGIIPCHRVVFADGSLAPAFAFGGEDEQHRLLEGEGVVFLADGRVDMARCQWEVAWPLDLGLGVGESCRQWGG